MTILWLIIIIQNVPRGTSLLLKWVFNLVRNPYGFLTSWKCSTWNICTNFRNTIPNPVKSLSFKFVIFPYYKAIINIFYMDFPNVPRGTFGKDQICYDLNIRNKTKLLNLKENLTYLMKTLNCSTWNNTDYIRLIYKIVPRGTIFHECVWHMGILVRIIFFDSVFLNVPRGTIEELEELIVLFCKITFLLISIICFI